MAKRKPGKYDHLLSKYKAMPPEDLKQHEKIQHRKITLRTCPRCDGSAIELSASETITTTPCQMCNGRGEWELTPTRIADLYIQARIDVLTIALAASRANIELEALTQLMIESQENKHEDWGAFGASDRSLRLTSGDTLRVQPELYGTVKNKSEFRKWCYANGQTDSMELPEKKTQDIVKARALVCDKEPDGIEIYTRAKIVYTPLKTEAPGQETLSDDDTISF